MLKRITNGGVVKIISFKNYYKGSFLNLHANSFVYSIGKKDFAQKTNQRYEYDYEAPEPQELNLTKLGFRILKGVLLTCSVVGLVYLLLFRKYNSLSKRYNYYFVDEYFELKMADYVSDKLKQIFENYIFRQDTEEALLVLKIYKRILKGNNIKIRDSEVDASNVYVIDSISIGTFLCKNGDLFISNRILELAGNSEDEIALFIAVEVASNLMGNFTNRVLQFFLYNVIYTDWNRTIMKKKSFFSHKMDYLNSFNRFLYFYPESVIGTYYEEAELIRRSLQLLNKAEFNIFQSVEFLKKFEDKMKYYPRHYKSVLFSNKESRYYDLAKNYLKIYLI